MGLDAQRFSERLLAAGFIVVPKAYSKPARRGNATKPKPYTGDVMIGTSHTAKLVG